MGRSASVAELPTWAGELLNRSRVGHLGLLDSDGLPRVLPVTYAVCGELLVSAIDHKRKRLAGESLARVRWLRARPTAALTIDRYDPDWSMLAWVQALGEISVVDVADAPAAVAALLERYEQYRERPPAGPVLVLRPRRLIWWRASG
jgi:PPOX class probable F420-dependent enzyme